MDEKNNKQKINQYINKSINKSTNQELVK